MCGLIGIVGDLGKEGLNIFTHMFFVNTLRGEDGCGVLNLFSQDNKKGKKGFYYDIDKDLLPSSEYVFKGSYKQFIMKGDSIALLGHSRAATMGGVKVDNCHPFLAKEGNVVGFHNGTIRSQFHEKHKYDTDSEALYNSIEQKGLKEALDDVHESSYWHDGIAYALQYYDRRNTCIHLIRNKKRPLWIYKDEDLIVWASEKSFIKFGFDRCGYDYSKGKFEELEVDTLVRIYPLKKKRKMRVYREWYKKPPEKKGTVWSNKGNQNYGSGWQRESDYNVGGSYNQKALFDDSKGNYVRYQIDNRLVSLKTLNKWVQEGCAVCGTNFIVTLHQVSFPFKFTQNASEVICNNCQSIAEEDFGMERDSMITPKRVVN